MTENRRIHRLTIGTAQLGMAYGVANVTGKPSRAGALAVVDTALARGITAFDTAQDYGECESLLGDLWADLGELRTRGITVVTKLGRAVDVRDPSAVRRASAESARRLRRRPSAILLHHPQHVDAALDGSWSTLEWLGDVVEADAVGVSTYTPHQFAQAVDDPRVGVIQAPLNILDQRLIRTGLLSWAERRGKRVFIRSVFLQGLLVLSAAALPEHMVFARPFLQRVAGICADHGCEVKAAALAFALLNSRSAEVIIGCETPAQLAENVELVQSVDEFAPVVEDLRQLEIPPDRVLDPRQWTAGPSSSS